MADLGEIVAQAERTLGPARGEPVRLTGGITNRNYRLRFGDRDCVLRLTGPETELLGIARTEWERDRNGEPIAASGLRITPRDLARIGVAHVSGRLR